MSWNQYTPKARRTSTPQIHEILRAGKVCVFFIDDRQVVRPNEVGSVRLIRDHAERLGSRVFEYQLEAQFRCAGSDAFVNWIDNTLDVARTAHTIWEGDESFDFQIVSSPEELEASIRSRAAAGFSARLTAGFCWKWSQPRNDGTLVDDVVIGGWRHPWNAKHEARKLAPGIPKASSGRMTRTVSIRSAASDLQVWVGRPEHSHDSVVKRSKQAFAELVKNTYRVLLSRGLKGCYVHFMDRHTERFVRSRMG